MSDYKPELGTCCACGGTENVRTILMLNKKSPTPGKGWGCFQCDLPCDGASYVICDRCFEENQDAREMKEPPPWPVRFACAGYPGVDGRVPIDSLTGQHDHDYSKHPEFADEALGAGRGVN